MTTALYSAPAAVKPPVPSTTNTSVSASGSVATWLRAVAAQPEIFEIYNEAMSALVDSGPLQAAIKLTVSVAAKGILRARSRPCCPGKFVLLCRAA